MKELEERIDAWAVSKGIGYELSPWLHKLTEEVGELNGAYVKEQHVKLVEEAADVLICLLMVASAAGIDLVQAAHMKMAINESRKLRVNDFGIGVKEGD